MDKGPLSPDGKNWWDGQKWNPVEQPAGPKPQPPHRAAGERSKWLTGPAVFAGLVLCFPIGLILTWLMPWSRRTKLGITAITSALLVFAPIGLSASSQPSTTRQSATVLPTAAVSLAPTSTATPTATPTAKPTSISTPTAAPPVQAPQPTSHADYLAELRAQGVSAICNDGTVSYSRNRSGTCSHHNGVREWTGLI